LLEPKVIIGGDKREFVNFRQVELWIGPSGDSRRSGAIYQKEVIGGLFAEILFRFRTHKHIEITQKISIY
jgi:hypothetical protein